MASDDAGATAAPPVPSPAHTALQSLVATECTPPPVPSVPSSVPSPTGSPPREPSPKSQSGGRGLCSHCSHWEAAVTRCGRRCSWRRGAVPTLRLMVAIMLLMIPLGTIDGFPRIATTFAAHLDKRPPTRDSVHGVYVTMLCALALMTPLLAAPLCDAARDRGPGSGLPLRIPLEGVIAAAGAATLGLSLLLACMVWTVGELAVSYGALQGTAAAVCHFVPMHYVANCFPHSLGLMAGFASAAYECGTLVVWRWQAALLGIDSLPEQYEDPDPSVATQVDHMLQLLSVICFCCALAGAALLPDREDVLLSSQLRVLRPHRRGSDQPLGHQYSHLSTSAGYIRLQGPPDASPHESAEHVQAERAALLRLFHFWLLPLMAFLMGLSGSLVLDNYRDIARYIAQLSSEDMRRDLVSEWHVGASCAGRLLWGMLSDVFGYHVALLAISVTLAALLISYGFAGGSALFQIWTCLLAFTYGGNYSVVPAAAAELFGSVPFGRAYSITFAGFCFGAAAARALADPFVSQIKESRSMLFVLAFLCGSANLLVFPARIIHHQRVEEATATAPFAPSDGDQSPPAEGHPRRHVQYDSTKSLQTMQGMSLRSPQRSARGEQPTDGSMPPAGSPSTTSSVSTSESPTEHSSCPEPRPQLADGNSFGRAGWTRESPFNQRRDASPAPLPPDAARSALRSSGLASAGMQSSVSIARSSSGGEFRAQQLGLRRNIPPAPPRHVPFSTLPLPLPGQAAAAPPRPPQPGQWPPAARWPQVAHGAADAAAGRPMRGPSHFSTSSGSVMSAQYSRWMARRSSTGSFATNPSPPPDHAAVG